MIATHDSATGEKGHGWVSWLVTPFAKTQSKTIREQYEAGARMFDIRVKKCGRVWRCAHGLWSSERNAADILCEIDEMEDPCMVMLTYEGWSGLDVEEFLELANSWRMYYKKIQWAGVYVKRDQEGKWACLIPSDGMVAEIRQQFKVLDGRSWHTLIPVPWLWYKVYGHRWDLGHCWNMMDFL